MPSSNVFKDGYKYYKKIDMMPIDRLNTSQPETSIPKGFIQAPMNIVEGKQEKDNTYLGWILLIVLIIIFLIAIYIFL